MGVSMRDSYEISTVYSRFHAVLFFAFGRIRSTDADFTRVLH